jgi:hypothetical protein
MTKHKCPVCKGSGEFEYPIHKEADVTEVNREIAVRLTSQGYSRRQVMRALGYKSVRSVQYLLNK